MKREIISGPAALKPAKGGYAATVQERISGMRNSMAKIIAMVLVVIIMPGCATYHTSLIKPTAVKTVQVDILKSNPPEPGILISDAIRNELIRKGFSVVSENADAKITGSVLLTQGGNWTVATKSWISAIIVQIQNRNGEIVLTSRFDQGSAAISWWGEKTAAEIGTEIGKNIAKKINR